MGFGERFGDLWGWGVGVVVEVCFAEGIEKGLKAMGMCEEIWDEMS